MSDTLTSLALEPELDGFESPRPRAAEVLGADVA
jgi:hypothetical protein